MLDDRDIGVAVDRPSRTQVVDGQVDRLRLRAGAQFARDPEDRRGFEEGADQAAMDGRQHRIADDLLRERHHQRAVAVDTDPEPAREGTDRERAVRILRRLQRRQFGIGGGTILDHVGAIGVDHEAGGRGRDRIVLGVLIGGGAHERDRAGDAIADRMGLQVETGRRRTLVVDAQIERGDGAEAIERELHRHAAGFVQHRGDDAAMQHADIRVADEDRPIGQPGPRLARRFAIEPEAADMPVIGAELARGAHDLLEGGGRRRVRRFSHANFPDL